MRSVPIPEDVAALAREFAAWRSQRPHLRAHLPDELVQKAAAAVRVHSVGVVARGIKVDRRRLNAAVARISDQRVASRKPAITASAVRLLPVKMAAAAAPIGAVVEIEDPAGWRLKLTCTDAASALKAFVEARR